MTKGRTRTFLTERHRETRRGFPLMAAVSKTLPSRREDRHSNRSQQSSVVDVT